MIFKLYNDINKNIIHIINNNNDDNFLISLFFNDQWVISNISFNINIRVTEFSDDETTLSSLAPLIEKSYYREKSDQTSDEWM